MSTSVKKGDTVRVGDVPTLPPPLRETQRTVVEVIEIRGRSHVRIRDPYAHGKTTSDDTHLPDAPTNPFVVTCGNYRTVRDG